MDTLENSVNYVVAVSANTPAIEDASVVPV